MLYKKSSGSGLLIVYVLVLIISWQLMDYSWILWLQARQISLEKLRIKHEKEQQDVLGFIKKTISKIIRNNNNCGYTDFVDKLNNITVQYNNEEIFFQPILKHIENSNNILNNYCKIYTVYKLDIRSVIDLIAMDAYHKHRYLYICICELADQDMFNQENQKIKAFFLSNFILA